MIKHYRNIVAAAGLWFALCVLSSCDPIIVKSEKNYIKDSYTFTNTQLPESPVSPFPAANVDYDKANNMVFVNFSDSSGKCGITEISNTVWDIAIVVGNGPDTGSSDAIYTVTNSGDYGENTFILPLKKGNAENDYIGKNISSVQQVCFKKDETDISPYQNDPDTGRPVANPFYTALTNEKKYFLRVGKYYDKARLFLIWFEKMHTVATGESYTLHFKPVTVAAAADGTRAISGFGTEYTLTGTIKSNYSFNYIKLSEGSARVLDSTTDGIPKKTEWQLLFMRTHIYSKEMGEVFKNDGIIGSSSILTNSPGGVQTAALYGWDFPEVTQVPVDAHFKRIIDGVGKGFANPLNDNPEKRRKAWYYGLNMPPTYYLNRNTYVFKWKSGGKTKYAKFRPGTFYGPNGEKFYVQFRYTVTVQD